MKKLLNKKGETIVETVAAMLVVAVAFLLLSGAVTAAARITDHIDDDETVLDLKNPVSTVSGTVGITFAGTTREADVTYNTVVVNSGEENESTYYYYAYKED